MKVVKLLGPGLLGFAAAQINLLVNTILASSTTVGAVSWLNYSFRLFQLPVGILSVSIGNSNLVHFSHCIKQGDRQEAARQLMASYFLSYFVVLPAMVVLIVFAEPIVHLIFERGKFTAESTLMTAKALRWYALGLPFYGLYKILVPSFYALDKQKVPVYTSLFSIALNIGFCLALVPFYGFEVLALGTTLSMFASSSIQSIMIKQQLQIPWSEFFSSRWLKLWPAAILSALLGWWLKERFSIFDQALLTKCAVLFSQMAAVGLTYLVILIILGERQGITYLRARLRRK